MRIFDSWLAGLKPIGRCWQRQLAELPTALDEPHLTTKTVCDSLVVPETTISDRRLDVKRKSRNVRIESAAMEREKPRRSRQSGQSSQEDVDTMRIQSVSPFIMHIPVTGNQIADSMHTITHWGVVGARISILRWN